MSQEKVFARLKCAIGRSRYEAGEEVQGLTADEIAHYRGRLIDTASDRKARAQAAADAEAAEVKSTKKKPE